MKFVEYTDSEIMWMDLANTIAGELNRALMTHDRVSLAVPGGTTPGPIFDSLCAADLDWENVHIMLTDERWVPESSPRSNTRLVKERLLTNRAAAATFIPFYSGDPEPEGHLDALIETVTAKLPISVLLLGMGADMHTASLFPGADQLAAALDDHAPPVMAMRAPGAPEARVTLTAQVLKGAMSKHLVITGADKRAAVELARHKSPLEAPIAAILPGTTVHWAE